MPRSSQLTGPIPGISLEEAFPQEEDFVNSYFHLHGVGHVSRVICNAIDLVKTHGPAEYMAPVWAAAFLHDLARRNDGVCNRHGEWAVQECWDMHVDRFRRAGVGPEWDERIKAAVVNHCDRFNLDRDDPAWRLAAFLKDADALDRYRLNESPDPRMLRFEHYEEVYFRAEQLERETDGMETGAEIWAVHQELGDREPRGKREYVQAEMEGLPAIPHINASRLDSSAGRSAGGEKESRR